jgi:hypothetical protein
MIDVTITATLRPEILERTLNSFSRNMFSLFPDTRRIRAIVNVDPAGNKNILGKQNEIIKIVDNYFDNALINLPAEAHFGRAFHWCWKQFMEGEAEFLFHLEEDWELLRPVSIWDMMTRMKAHLYLAALRLSMFPAGETPIHDMKNWNRWVPWNALMDCYVVKQEERHRIGVCGHPTLFHKNFVSQVFPLLNPEENPEKQFQGTNKKITEFILSEPWVFGVWSKPGDQPYVRDIGRQWMREHNFIKSGNKAYFLTWEEEEVA